MDFTAFVEIGETLLAVVLIGLIVYFVFGAVRAFKEKAKRPLVISLSGAAISFVLLLIHLMTGF